MLSLDWGMMGICKLTWILAIFLNLPHLFNNDYEYGVWPRTHIVHISACKDARLLTPHHELASFNGRSHSPLGEPFHKNTPFRIFSNLKTGPLRFQQITDHLIVDLEVASANHKRRLLVLWGLNVAKNLLHWAWNYPSRRISPVIFESLHCVRLSGSCLPKSKQRCIVSRKHAQNGRFCGLRVHL